MNDNGSNASKGGVGAVSLLTIAFVILKLCKVIDWSWWWVLSPLWISFGLFLLILGICLIVAAVKK